LGSLRETISPRHCDMNTALFPVTHSVIHGASVLEKVAEAYDFPVVSCRLLKPSLNDTYLLTTRDNRYVVRVYRAKRFAAEIAYELDLLNHLAAKNVPVSVPVAAKDGHLFVSLFAPEGIRHFVVFSYSPGTPMVWTNADHCYLAGRLLATIHAGSEEFESRHARSSLDLAYLIDSPLAAVQPFLVHRPADFAYLDELATKLRSYVIAAKDAGLGWGVCHGDFGAKNILVSPNEVVVLDFDFCGVGWRSYDFTSIRKAAIEHHLPTHWESFLRGYTEIRPLADIDRKAVHVFRALRTLSMLGVFAQNADEWGAEILDDRRLDRWLRFFRRWEAEPLEGRDNA
jgi:Ser/Thr protein kinase RdoA (MazF antagonist)